MRRLEDRVAIITGAASGIGRASAIRFVEEGASVVVADIDTGGGEETLSMMKKAGGEGLFVPTDVSSKADVDHLVKTAGDTCGRIDILFNNAGIAIVKTIDELEEDEWDRQFAVNIKSMYLTIRAVLPYMRKLGKGAIINTSSVNGVLTEAGQPAYCATKGGIIAFTKALGLELVREGIRVNCICPGYIKTPLGTGYLDVLPEGEREKALAEVDAVQMAGRIGRPEEVAALAAFLASDDASYCAGGEFFVDGGMTAGVRYFD
jgi:NAD(P)-dependent dehydrogenase (short-subunit alcohol dehydrogenase family)